jgi:hypothetical protein
MMEEKRMLLPYTISNGKLILAPIDVLEALIEEFSTIDALDVSRYPNPNRVRGYCNKFNSARAKKMHAYQNIYTDLLENEYNYLYKTVIYCTDDVAEYFNIKNHNKIEFKSA